MCMWSSFIVEHVLMYKRRGFIALRCNILRNIIAGLWRTMASPLNQHWKLKSWKAKLEAERQVSCTLIRTKRSSRGFFTAGQTVFCFLFFFLTKVFYSDATRYANQSLQQFYALNENEKKKKHCSRVRIWIEWVSMFRTYSIFITLWNTLREH